MGPGRSAPPGPPSGPPSERDPEAGAAALEFALVAPLLFVLVFGIFATGWGLWEYQAAQATTREAARLASLGVTSTDGYVHDVRCLAKTNGLGAKPLTHVDLAFHGSASTLDVGSVAAPGGYTTVRLTYTSAVRGVPLVPWPASVTVQSVARVEQVGDVTTAQSLDLVPGVTEESCP